MLFVFEDLLIFCMIVERMYVLMVTLALLYFAEYGKGKDGMDGYVQPQYITLGCGAINTFIMANDENMARSMLCFFFFFFLSGQG